jgi:hypothetical protein
MASVGESKSAACGKESCVMAKLIYVDGGEREVFPKSTRRGFTLQELYDLIPCTTVEHIELADGKGMWMNEDGKYDPNLKPNARATELLHAAGGIPDDRVVGNVLITDRGEVR